MKCIECEEEFEAERSSARFCSANCRVVHGRKISKLSQFDLNQAIRAYPGDTWKDSPEFKELQRRLETMSVEELEKDGYWIPSWKRAGQIPPWEIKSPNP